ncbi:MAG: flagellar basal body rod C-terminal domain-containing protein [Paracoccaceae bacterium]
MLSLAGAERQAADARASYLGAQYTSLRGLELQSGVDTDAEMQNLLLVEQAYAANAKVVQAVDDMIQTLLGI